MKQKFKHGDLVRVADDLGPSMEHFSKACNAIVIGSYRDKYSGSSSREPEYTLFIEGQNESSWYYEHQLAFIRHDPALLETWREHAEAKLRDQASLPWIKAHWSTIRTHLSSTSILALFNLVGYQSGFLRNGEYFTLYHDMEQASGFFDALLTSNTAEEFIANLELEQPETIQTARLIFEKLNAALSKNTIDAVMES